MGGVDGRASRLLRCAMPADVAVAAVAAVEVEVLSQLSLPSPLGLRRVRCALRPSGTEELAWRAICPGAALSSDCLPVDADEAINQSTDQSMGQDSGASLEPVLAQFELGRSQGREHSCKKTGGELCPSS